MIGAVSVVIPVSPVLEVRVAHLAVWVDELLHVLVEVLLPVLDDVAHRGVAHPAPAAAALAALLVELGDHLAQLLHPLHVRLDGSLHLLVVGVTQQVAHKRLPVPHGLLVAEFALQVARAQTSKLLGEIARLAALHLDFRQIVFV